MLSLASTAAPFVSKSLSKASAVLNSPLAAWASTTIADKAADASLGPVYIPFTDAQIRQIARDDQIAFEITRIQLCQRPLRGDPGWLDRVVDLAQAFAGEAYRLIPRISHRFLVFELATPFTVPNEHGSFSMHRKVIAERLDDRFVLGLLVESSAWSLDVVTGFESGVAPPGAGRKRRGNAITLKDVARSFLSHQALFPSYHIRTTNCWFFCVGMLHLLTHLPINSYFTSVDVTEGGHWRRLPNSPPLSPQAKMVFECVYSISLDKSKGGGSGEEVLEMVMGDLCRLLPEKRDGSSAEVKRKVAAFEVCMQILRFYRKNRRAPSLLEMAVRRECRSRSSRASDGSTIVA